MRYLGVAVLMLALSGCNSAKSVKDEANREYAVNSYEQSLEAYQLCVAQHPNDQQRCSAVARVIDADRKRYEKLPPAL
ncbi:hypothetical protein WOC76_09030 [Methylocystis sp. IM3]|jgi:hypothetical protein|uniref:hypothetical protein n=1 Tax=unclassified Methylocystis TaxID=2625913 RepID=UPI000F98228F|nr:MAG: hypothetical protein EKK29_03010 [Hyphomicrobiales bacterium]